MSTVSEIIHDALGHLGVVSATETAEAWQLEDAVRRLNLMMTRWEGSGISVGWVNVDNPDDPMPCPPEAEEAIGYNLALKLRPKYGVEIDPDVIEFARSGKNALMADISTRDAARIVYDLPLGEAETVGDFYTDTV